MMDFLRAHQLNMMLILSGICAVISLFVLLTKILPKRKKIALLALELSVMVMLIADRYAYIYRGDVSELGYWMVRVSNFLVFFMTLMGIFALNLYLEDMFINDLGFSSIPTRLKIADVLVLVGIILVIVSQFTGLYYTFDETNHYQRSNGYIISYLISVAILLVQLSLMIQYYKRISRGMRLLLILFIVVPMFASVLQVFTYGVSLNNLSFSAMSILLYFFVLQDMNETVARTNQLEIEYLEKDHEITRRLFDETARALTNAIDAKDPYTRGHSLRVAEYSRRIAELSGRNEEDCDKIFYAALLHDVGKIGIPSSIINKNGKLTDEEYSLIKQHTVFGNQILSSITDFPYLSTIAHYHHERYDGKGYPENLKGEEIPEDARIVAVADSYDAMTSKRSYRDPLPQQVVRDEIVKGSGTQFDPKYAAIMLKMIDEDENYEMKERDERSYQVNEMVVSSVQKR